MTPREEAVNRKYFSLPKTVISPIRFTTRKGKITHPNPDKAPFMSDRLSLIFEATQIDR